MTNDKRGFFRRVFGSLGRDVRRLWPGFGRVAAMVSLLGLLVLVFIAGQAVMFFGAPTSDYLQKAFMGIERQLLGDKPNADPNILFGGTEKAVFRPDKVCQGFTLISTSEGPEVKLLDLRGDIVHRWTLPQRRTWPHAPEVEDPPADATINCERAYLYPNGDLLALCAVKEKSPYGYAVVKLNKKSELLWGYSAGVHHDFDVAEDGRIYLLTKRSPVKSAPSSGLPADQYTAEFLVILSPDGKELDSIPLYEALRDSPFHLLFLLGVEGRAGFDPMSPMPPSPHAGGMRSGPNPPGPLTMKPPTDPHDIMHANSVKVLSQKVAPHFSQFRAGAVLISFREANLLAVLEPGKRTVVWAATGPWVSQHDAHYLDNGHILLFDNFGSSRSSRVLEYDPVSQSIAWAYSSLDGARMVVPVRGCCQPLPNGNFLIVDPGRKLLEMTRNKELAWEWKLPETSAPATPEDRLYITGARRYTPDQVPFLSDDGKRAQ